jgi:nicotinamide-nucleotide amidase
MRLLTQPSAGVKRGTLTYLWHMLRPLRTAVILAVGSELTTGSTRDTNSGDLARELSALGVDVLRMAALPDRLEAVTRAFQHALADADLVVATGGLGPTPDDLTREAIAAATGLAPAIDPELERWLRALFTRRRVEMPESNLKQAWLLPGAMALHNANGTAPGWWLDLADGRVVAALPGPPREMWPMWRDAVLPRLRDRGAGAEVAGETLRLTGIGESALVELIGEGVLRNPEPEIATYARADGVDVRVTAHGDAAAERVRRAVDQLLPAIGAYVFARGDEGWPQVLARCLAGRSLAVVEVGVGGRLVELLGEAPFVAHAEVLRDAGDDLQALAAGTRARHDADVAIAVRATPAEGDTRVEIGIAAANGAHLEERRAFLTGVEGHRRAALAACTALWQWIGGAER